MTHELLHSAFIGTLLSVPLLLTPASLKAQVFISKGGNFIGMHRTTPSIADYNNDGMADVYYGGMTWLLDSDAVYPVKSWTAQGFLYTAQNDGSFAMGNSNLSNEDGKFLANGLPPSYRQKIIWFDANNDGNLDFLCGGKSDGDLQIEGTPDKQYMWLFLNGGPNNNWQFTQVANNGLLQSVDNAKGGDYPNGNASYFDVGDYDNDGYQDVVMIGEHNYYTSGDEQSWERYAKLFHNNGDGTFTEKLVFNPIPYDSNPRPDNLFEIDDNTLEAKPLMKAKPMSSGSVRFADLNNDGQLDIVMSGWVDGTLGGGAIYIYKNNGDGTYQEVDLNGQNFVGTYEGDLCVADFNQDGWLDILSTGTPNEGNKRADIYFNNGASGKPFTFTASTVDGGNGLYGVAGSVAEAADLNGDGLTDVILSGWTNVDNKQWGTYVFFQNPDQTFTVQDGGLHSFSSGGFALGNLYGDNSLDLFTVEAAYTDNWQLICQPWQNSYHENTAPSTPSDVEAVDDGNGNVTITWNSGEDDQTASSGLAYNVYVQNTDNGHIAMLLPADTLTGKLRTLRDWQLLCHGDASLTYPIHLAAGNYKIGVSTVDPGYMSSSFITTQIGITTTGIRQATDKQNISIENKQGGIVVHAYNNLPVRVFNNSGAIVGTGSCNEMIPLKQGMYIVKAGTNMRKVTIL